GIALAGELGDDLLDRSARRELDQAERYRHDPEYGRDHEKDAPQDIGAHQPAAPPAVFRVSALANGLSLVLVEPPKCFHRKSVVGLWLLEPEHVPKCDAVIRRMPIW